MIHSSGHSLLYGEKCMPSPENGTDSVDTMCNSKETLTCQDGTCLCSDMSTMIYDPAVGLCVGRSGENCVYHKSESHLPTFRKTHCVPYATCEDGKCTCWSAFYMDETGHCSRRRGYMQQCRMDHQCNQRSGYICKDGLCQCDDQVATYNPEIERCVGLPDKSCLNMYRECVENYKCKLGVCSCKFKEIQGSDGDMKCDSNRHKYGKNCGKRRGTCGDELTCVNGKCRCPNPDYQVYDYEQKKCLGLVGGPCTVIPSSSSSNLDLKDVVLWRAGLKKGTKINKEKKESDNKYYSNSTDIDQDQTSTISSVEEPSKMLNCISYARCLPYGSQSEVSVPEMGRCECDKGFVETKRGKCQLSYGAPCDTHSKNKKDICDESVPLYCVNNICNCKNELDVYELETKRCKKSIGSLCWKDASCVLNARCIRYSPKLPGRCMCPPNSQPDSTSSNCLVYDANSSISFEEEDDDLEFDDGN
ncbi:unnamed protein product [Orchesella dallaii]|uniref:EB domain-containing protein n=1 Tax=Orchesella dallaii TaxID=48710 RepID=A0ABP1PPP0_9HEXA